MVKQIFISHSREDKEIVEFFLGTFGLAGYIRPVLVEYETRTEPDWEAIQHNIESPLTCAVFVLLGPHILYNAQGRRKQHTPNWITWETGIARQARKDIWVFEDYNTPIDFPIPYFDHYMRYNLGLEEHRVYIANKIRDYTPILRHLQIMRLTESARRIKCLCGITFYYHNVENVLQCPKCKKVIKI